jgi:hypothetical protein
VIALTGITDQCLLLLTALIPINYTVTALIMLSEAGQQPQRHRLHRTLTQEVVTGSDCGVL